MSDRLKNSDLALIEARHEQDQTMIDGDGLDAWLLDIMAHDDIGALLRDRTYLVDRIEQLEAENQRLKTALAESCEDMRNEFPARTCGLTDQYEATLKSIQELPEKWRKYSFDNPEAAEYIDSADCADELEALLPKE